MFKFKGNKKRKKKKKYPPCYSVIFFYDILMNHYSNSLNEMKCYANVLFCHYSILIKKNNDDLLKEKRKKENINK